MIIEYHESNGKEDTKVIEYLAPKDLQEKMDFKVGEKGVGTEEILKLIG